MSPSSKRIGAVVLAAGGSSRFGEPKQLIAFRGKSLVRRITDAASEAGCSPVVVVIGSNDKKFRRVLDQACIVIVQNKQWRCGIGSSIRCGIQELINSWPDVEAGVLLVCDQPAVDARVIERLMALFETTGKNIVASNYTDTLGVPVLFARSIFEELLSLGDKAGAKSIVLRSSDRVASFPFPEGQTDIDTLEDWNKLEHAAEKRTDLSTSNAEVSPTVEGNIRGS